MSEETKAMHSDDVVRFALEDTLKAIGNAKPKERSELARRYAILKTELEKALAYHEVYIQQRSYWPIEDKGN